MLTFDESKHEYAVEGVRLPSVTQVLKSLGMYKGEDFFKPEGLVLGHYIHSACEYYDKGTLDEETLDDSLRGYLDAWKQFRMDTKFTPLLIEQPLQSRIHRFAGTPDRFGTIGNEFWLPDIKHGGYQPCDALQTAGYSLLLMESEYGKAIAESRRPIKRMSVYLEPNGRYFADEHKELTDIPGFMECLGVYRRKERYGIGNNC